MSDLFGDEQRLRIRCIELAAQIRGATERVSLAIDGEPEIIRVAAAILAFVKGGGNA